MANEPPNYSMANAILREYQFNFDELEEGMDEARFDEDFDAIALVACRDIGRNRERSCGSTAPLTHDHT